MGIQSGSQRTLDLYRRPFSNEQVQQAAALLNRYSDSIPAPQYDMILDNPWETEEDLADGLRLLSRLPVPFHLQLFSLSLYPGTELQEKAEDEGLPQGQTGFKEYRRDRTSGAV